MSKLAEQKPKTKFFRIAVEGQTTDGRTISRDWITQMAAGYSATKYGARINLEHFRGLLPDSPFRAYGDVLALESRDLDGEFAGKVGLYAQISPTDDLIALAKKRQKIYTSMEVDPDFAKTGEAYLVALAITDSPASLGTDVLTFAAGNPAASPFTAKKQKPDNLFSSATFEIDLELETPVPDTVSVFSKVKEMLGIKGKNDDARFSDMADAVDLLATHGKEQTDLVQKLSAQVLAQEGTITELQTQGTKDREAFTALQQQLSNEEGKQPPRPAATGGNGAAMTDC